MAEEIIDGNGSGYRAKVDENRRLHTDAISRDQLEQAALIGQAYNFSTGVISLTTDASSALFYLDYQGDLPLEIKEIGVSLGQTTGGAGNGVIEIIKNPTSGTIIDNALVIPTTDSNRDFSSTNDLDATKYKGANGYTFTDGNDVAITSRSTFDEPVIFDAAPFVLRKGNSIGVRYTPPTGNTSQTAVVFLTCFVETSDYNGTR